MKNNKPKSKKSSSNLLATSVITGLAAGSAALLVFFYGTKKGKEERKKIKGWMLMLKGEVVHKLESLKDINKEVYEKVVDEVSEKFSQVQGLSQKEISGLSKALKTGWEDIKKKVMFEARNKSK